MRAVASSKGQIVIPAPLRKKYGIKKGTVISISDQNGKIVLQTIEVLLDKLRGSLKGSGALKEFKAERARDRKREDGDWVPPSFR